MLFVLAEGFTLIISGLAQTLGLGKVSEALVLAFSWRGSRGCFLHAADGSCVTRFAHFACWPLVVASAALAVFASRGFGILFLLARARLWRCLACAMGFGSGQGQCARRCKHSPQVPNNRPTRRCTRPPTASALVASSRRLRFRRRVSLVVRRLARSPDACGEFMGYVEDWASRLARESRAKVKAPQIERARRCKGLTQRQHILAGAQLEKQREELFELQNAIGHAYGVKSKAYSQIDRIGRTIDELRISLDNAFAQEMREENNEVPSWSAAYFNGARL